MGMLETYLAQVSKDSRLEDSNERCGGYRVCNHSDCLVVNSWLAVIFAPMMVKMVTDLELFVNRQGRQRRAYSPKIAF